LVLCRRFGGAIITVHFNAEGGNASKLPFPLGDPGKCLIRGYGFRYNGRSVEAMHPFAELLWTLFKMLRMHISDYFALFACCVQTKATDICPCYV